jgi:hypothetical protein
MEPTRNQKEKEEKDKIVKENTKGKEQILALIALLELAKGNFFFFLRGIIGQGQTWPADWHT